MNRYSIRLTFTIGLAVCLMSVIVRPAFGTFIDDFEDTSNPEGWTGDLGFNANGTFQPTYSTNNVYNGTKSALFSNHWVIPGSLYVSNAFVQTDDRRYWGVYYSISHPENLSGNSISQTSGVLSAFFYNDNDYPIQISLVLDCATSDVLERGPFQSAQAHRRNGYLWDLSAEPGHSFPDQGELTLPNNVLRLKGLLIYSPVEPTQENCNVYLDDISTFVNQQDSLAPSPPEILRVTKGTSPGQVTITWEPNAEPDLGGYHLYVANDGDFGSSETNRLTFPSIPAVTLDPALTIKNLPSGSGANEYFAISAFDRSTPPNESVKSDALGVLLSASGDPPLDHVILTHHSALPSSPQSEQFGYSRAIVYNGMAIKALGRTYDSAVDLAVDEQVMPLTPSAQGVVVWSSLLDGNFGINPALTDESIQALSDFLDGDGNLLISGSGVAEDLASRTSASQAFLVSQLKAHLENGNVAVGSISGTGTFASFPSSSVSLSSVSNEVAYQTLSHDLVTPVDDGAVAMLYTGVSEANGGAAVVEDSKSVLFGFGFESVGVSGSATNTRQRRQDLYSLAVDYLTNEAGVADWDLY